MSNVPPGWYPDPENQEQTRYWDGNQWTEQTGMIGGPSAATPPGYGPYGGSADGAQTAQFPTHGPNQGGYGPGFDPNQPQGGYAHGAYGAPHGQPGGYGGYPGGGGGFAGGPGGPPMGPGGPGGQGQQPPKKSRTGLIVLLTVLGVILIGGGISAFLIFGGDDDENPTTQPQPQPTEEPTTEEPTTEEPTTEEPTTEEPTTEEPTTEEPTTDDPPTGGDSPFNDAVTVTSDEAGEGNSFNITVDEGDTATFTIDVEEESAVFIGLETAENPATLTGPDTDIEIDSNPLDEVRWPDVLWLDYSAGVVLEPGEYTLEVTNETGIYSWFYVDILTGSETLSVGDTVELDVPGRYDTGPGALAMVDVESGTETEFTLQGIGGADPTLAVFDPAAGDNGELYYSDDDGDSYGLPSFLDSGLTFTPEGDQVIVFPAVWSSSTAGTVELAMEAE